MRTKRFVHWDFILSKYSSTNQSADQSPFNFPFLRLSAAQGPTDMGCTAWGQRKRKKIRKAYLTAECPSLPHNITANQMLWVLQTNHKQHKPSSVHSWRMQPHNCAGASQGSHESIVPLVYLTGGLAHALSANRSRGTFPRADGEGQRPLSLCALKGVGAVVG